MVISNVEHYIVGNGVLFRLMQQKKVFDTSIKCLLVIPENFENSVFHMFHDTLLGARHSPVNMYYTIKDQYWIHNMFEKLQRYICDMRGIFRNIFKCMNLLMRTRQVTDAPRQGSCTVAYIIMT